jgi:hypothetical protein
VTDSDPVYHSVAEILISQYHEEEDLRMLIEYFKMSKKAFVEGAIIILY